MTARSAWRTPAPGITAHPSQHKVCQMQIDKGRGPCECPEYGGHEPASEPRESESA